jgi:hypothetical protein
MRKLPPLPNLTALLALAALADLLLFRVATRIFLPTRDGTRAERWLSAAGLFSANFASILGLVLVVVALVLALGGDRIFPRGMRITVSTVGLFFCVLAAMGVLWNLAPQLAVHLRVSHAFLTLFLTVGVWLGRCRWRCKVGTTLFALPIVIQAFVIFAMRMDWSHVASSQLARLAHATSLTALLTAPMFLTTAPWTRLRALGATTAGLLLAAGFAAALVWRFDVTQAALYYGLRIEIGGIASTAERIYAGALVAAYASLGAGIAANLLGSGRSRLAGWGLLLIGVAGAEVASPKAALFTLCGLLALVASGDAPVALAAAADDPLLPPPAAPSAQN